MGHLTKDCPEKKSKDSNGGSGGGFVVMCVEGGESPVEEDPEQSNLESNFEAELVVLIPTATPLMVIRRLSLPSSNPSHCHTR